MHFTVSIRDWNQINWNVRNSCLVWGTNDFNTKIQLTQLTSNPALAKDKGNRPYLGHPSQGKADQALGTPHAPPPSSLY